jgi:ABC-2 type transport system permease protein
MTLLIAQLTWKTALQNRAVWLLYALLAGLTLYALALGWVRYGQQQATQVHYSEEARHDWLSNPDKHPHRMAHYGHFAIRPAPPLALLDIGMERYMGSVIYLEAHKQNTVNFSEASLSTGLMRFGELSVALLLQLLLPLLAVFLGFGTLATDRERGTLKLLLAQGASWGQLLAGYTLGVLGLLLIVALPVLGLAGLTLWLLPGYVPTPDDLARYALLAVGYVVYLAVFGGLAVLVSARSQTAKTALVSLIGVWLGLTIVLPRVSQAVGTYLYTTPSKAAFETAIQADVLREGDSHNPNDPHYKALKDSVLAAHGADSVEQLPFNYAGFIMAEGERATATIYNRHFADLQTVYDRQNQLARAVSFLNPYIAIRNLSMALCATDYGTYLRFQQQAETYRYQLAQTMNALQMRYIGTRATDPRQISRQYWQDVPDFDYQPAHVGQVLRHEWPSVLALVGWLLGLGLVGWYFTKTRTAA